MFWTRRRIAPIRGSIRRYDLRYRPQNALLLPLDGRAILAPRAHDATRNARADGPSSQSARRACSAILDIEEPHKELVLVARSTVEKLLPPPVDLTATTPWDELDYHLLRGTNQRDANNLMFRCVSRLTTPTLEIADYASLSFAPSRPVLEGAMDLVMRVYNDFKFDPHATDVSTPITKVFALRRGVCQDFAHLTLACFRALRIPARYVSGYLHTRPPIGRPKLQGADASHAWISVWSPEYGWVDFDPTNGILVRDEHVTVAFGRDYDDVSPISGVLRGGGEHTVDVGVDVNAVANATTG
jgi:transglutaminase-like putative cysteine protease